MTSTVHVGEPDWVHRHLEKYLATHGEDGHFLDFTPAGGRRETPTLVLRTIGRKTGEAHMTPLIYGRHGREFVVIASKGGAPEHPAWYLNLQSGPDVAFQVGDKVYRGHWRAVEGAERARLWEEMVELYPPYRDYQAGTDRKIPVIILDPREEIAEL